ncbi:MAG: hypothetical protein M5U28_20495 [Sandaracinaceae bacterium]|nr:hypothetical protein [Sandaracinaceae bacterium]
MPPPRRSSAGPDIQELIAEAREGRFGPVYVLYGTERFLIERATSLLKRAAVGDGIAGFNDDLFHGNAGLSAQRVIAAARTLPMMASARFILVRDVDAAPAEEIEALAAYVAAPVDTTCLVLTASKLDKRSKLAKAAGGGVRGQAAQGPGPQALRLGRGQAARARAHPARGRRARRGHRRGSRRHRRRGGAALALRRSGEAHRRRGRGGLRHARGDRQHLAARRRRGGAQHEEGAARGGLPAGRPRGPAADPRHGGAPAAHRGADAGGPGERHGRRGGGPGVRRAPLQARELKESARRFNLRELSAAFTTLALADLALKGSRVPPERVLEDAILSLCSGRARTRERIPRRQRTYR